MWKPIETAPKDETRILVIGGMIEHEKCFSSYNEPLKIPMLVENICGEWLSVHSMYYTVKAKNPTHWMPLPKPPKGE